MSRESFDVNHSEDHWSNEEKAISLIEKIILPYVTETRERLAMPAQPPWLLISDVFKGQWTPRVKNLVTENHGKMVPIPGNMTHIFHPLDVSVNRSCKSLFKASAQQWYADQVSIQVNEGKQLDDIKVDLPISLLKPLHAKWVVQFYDKMQNEPHIVVNGWLKSGIMDALRADISVDDPFVEG